RLVRQVLETAAAAGRVVRAGRVDPHRPGFEHVDGQRLGVVSLHLRHPRAHEVAREPSSDEDDEAVQPCDTVPAEGERVDTELELLVERDGCGHGYASVAR